MTPPTFFFSFQCRTVAKIEESLPRQFFNMTYVGRWGENTTGADSTRPYQGFSHWAVARSWAAQHRHWVVFGIYSYWSLSFRCYNFEAVNITSVWLEIAVPRRSTLYIIGLGLGDEKDITVRGLEAVKKCNKIYLEAYTSILGVKKEKLVRFYSVFVFYRGHTTVNTALRNRRSTMVRLFLRQTVTRSRSKPTKFWTVLRRKIPPSLSLEIPLGACTLFGCSLACLRDYWQIDIRSATTHTDLVLRAWKRNIPTEVIHNASIMNAIGCTGLQLYSFGHTVSIPFWTETWKPDSFYDRIKANKQLGLHTLCLLDIKVKEQSVENLLRYSFLSTRVTCIRCWSSL
jgi:hypothetical protein